MMRGVAPKLETHHRVRILDEAVVESVRLSRRYIPARQLPDKSVSVLDTACAKVAIGVAATPAQIEDRQRTIQAIDREIEILEREAALGGDHRERLEQARSAKEAVEKDLSILEEKWKKEREIVEKIAKVREGIEKARGQNGDKNAPAPAELDAMRRELESLKKDLAKAQGESALVHAEVDGQAVAAVISSWTGVPVGRMVADEIQTLLDLGKKLQSRVIGQDHALEAIAQRIRTSRAKLENPSKPVGVFLLVGPSGVGKTETALTLAETLYGGEHNLITINMSEYQESHTVSSLKGSPPGYVGYGEGGVLTEAVRRRPYSVVLLDEVEKAHPDVMELFFQVFDKGMLEDGEGREIDFKNTIILLTSNVGSDTIMKLSADPDTMPEAEALAEAIRPELLKAFPAALLGRMITVAYYPIAGEVLQKIIRLQLDRIARRIRENHQAELVYAEDLVKTVAARCTESASGARNVDAILTRSLLPEISREFLSRMVRGESYKRVEVGVDGSGQFSYQVI
jgi:type VI secretion system protein VasG